MKRIIFILLTFVSVASFANSNNLAEETTSPNSVNPTPATNSKTPGVLDNKGQTGINPQQNTNTNSNTDSVNKNFSY